MNAQQIAETAASLVGGDRAVTHGDMVVSHGNIAGMWSAYLGCIGVRVELSARDAAMMMALVKVARSTHGAHNPDDYVDLAGYAAVAGEIASREVRE